MTQIIGTAMEPYNQDDDHEPEHDVIEAVEVPETAVAERPKTFATVYTARDHERRPVVPAALRNRDERRALARHHGGRAAHVVAYHGVRTPVYVPVATGYAFRGVHRVWRHWTGWAFDRENAPTRAEAIRTLQLAEARSQYRQRKDRIRWRGPVFWATNTAAVGFGTAGWIIGTPWERYLGLAALVASMAYIGRPKDKPMFKPAVVKAQYKRLTAEMVEAGLIASGLVKVDKEGRHQLRWIAPCARDGRGWGCTVDMPPGTTFDTVINARASIASGLGVATDQVWLEKDRQSEARVHLWVGDLPMSQVKPPAWPLLRSGAVDLFKAFPFANTARGKVASLNLMSTNLLVGAVPGQGKSFSARVAALAAALDPTAELHVFDLKGSADWMPFTQVAHVIGIGDEPEDLTAFVTDLRAIKYERQRRYGVLRRLAEERDPRIPEGKLTGELVKDKSLGMHPLVLLVDEVQTVFEKECEHRDEAAALLADIVKKGRAVGIIAIVATQKPDRDSLPTTIRDNIGSRLGLRVLTPSASDMILGGSMSAAGYRCQNFTRADLGIGYLIGGDTDSDAEVVKVFYVDAHQAETVITRARGIREQRGTLTGQAIGQQPILRSSLLDDVATVLVADRMHCGDLADSLVIAFPEQYAGMDATKLGASLRAQGVKVGQTKVNGLNRAGVTRREIERVIAARERDTD